MTFAAARVTAVGFQWVGDTVVFVQRDGLVLLLHVYRHMSQLHVSVDMGNMITRLNDDHIQHDHTR